MAPLTTKGGAHRRRPSLRGIAYTRVVNGVEVQQSWPKKRGKKLHPKTVAQMEIFRQAQWAFKLSAPLVQRSFTEAVKGTPLMPRDLFLMAVSGRMHVLVTPDGRKMYPMAGIQNVSDSLDWIAQLKGQLMVRGADRWEPVAAGTADQILTFDAATELPVWRDPPTVTPGDGGTPPAWGDLTGDLTDQTDLTTYIAAQIAAIPPPDAPPPPAWGDLTGDLTDQTDLTDYVAAQIAAIPPPEGTTAAEWGAIVGDIATQADLVAYVAAQIAAIDFPDPPPPVVVNLGPIVDGGTPPQFIQNPEGALVLAPIV